MGIARCLVAPPVSALLGPPEALLEPQWLKLACIIIRRSQSTYCAACIIILSLAAHGTRSRNALALKDQSML